MRYHRPADPAKSGAHPYDAFISYSHVSDGALALALRDGLQRFATSWSPFRWLNPVRSLRIFRDESVLAADPALWPAIERALMGSDWLILLASPEAAKSPWVDKEAAIWCSARPAERILLVLTDGEIVWDHHAHDFDWTASTALPRRLAGMFSSEPRWIDMRWARSKAHITLSDPRFSDAVADLASPLRGIPKDDLIGDDIRQHRRLRRWRNSAVVLLSILFVGALVAAEVARRQRSLAVEREHEAIARRKEAERQTQIAVSRQLVAQSNLFRVDWVDRVELSLLLAVESVRRQRSFEGVQALSAALALTPRRLAAFQHEGSVNVQNRIWDLAFSPDGSLLASASADGTAMLWRVVGDTNHVLLSHEVPKAHVDQAQEDYIDLRLAGVGVEVRALGFSPDGGLLATGNEDGRVVLWDVVSGDEQLTFVHDDGVVDLVFHANGRHLASASEDGTARIWDIDTGNEVGRLSFGSGDYRRVVGVAFSPDGRFLAAISSGGRVCVWDTKRSTEKDCVLTKAAGRGLTYHPDGKSLATASENFALIWDVERIEPRLRMEHGDHLADAKMHNSLWINDVGFRPDGRYLATASHDRTARLWDATTGREAFGFRHASPVSRLAFSPDGRNLATATGAGNVHLWDALTGRERLRASLGRDNSIDALVFAPDGRRFAAGNVLGEVGVWALGAGTEAARVRHPDDVLRIAFSGDGRYMATIGADAKLRLWSTDGWRQIAEIGRFKPRIRFSADNAFLAVHSRGGGLEVVAVGSDPQPIVLAPNARQGDVAMGGRRLFLESRGTFAVWEASGGSPVVSGIGFEKPLEDWAISDDGRVLATAYRKGSTVQIWDTDAARVASEIAPDESARKIALSPRGDRLAILQHQRFEGASGSAAFRAWIDVWDLSDGVRQARFQFGSDVPPHFFFHPDGRRLLVMKGHWPSPNAITIYDAANPEQPVRLRGAKELRRVRFSPDGEFLAAISERRARVWDLKTGHLVARTPATELEDIRFTRDGRYLATASRDNTATLWYWRPDDLVAQACQRLTRNLSRDEWRDFLGGEPYRKTCPDLPSEATAVGELN